MRKNLLVLVLLLILVTTNIVSADWMPGNEGCAYQKDTACTFYAEPTTDDFGNNVEGCVMSQMEEVFCDHDPISLCGQVHETMSCNPNASTAAECVPIAVSGSLESTCILTERPMQTRHCECVCENSAGEFLMSADTTSFMQLAPFIKSCKEEFLSYLPKDENGNTPEEFACEGYTEESYMQYMEDSMADTTSENPDPRDLEDYMESGQYECGLFTPPEHDNDDSGEDETTDYEDDYGDELLGDDGLMDDPFEDDGLL